MTSLDDLLSIYEARGDRQYAGEPVDQLAHAWQAFLLAKDAQAGPTLQLAAFFHDVGHLFDDSDIPHERVGAAVLAGLLGPTVAQVVALHVDAKRYLVATEPEYAALLSQDSARSLVRQGGPMTHSETLDFRRKPGVDQAIRLRRWDEAAKDGSILTPPFQLVRETVHGILPR
jgi:predicted HD phosphohydrolase